MRILRGIAAAAALTLLIGIVAAVIFMHTAEFSRILRGWVNDYLAASFVGKISVADLEVSLSGELQLRYVTIADNTGEILTIPQVTVGYSVLPILWHSVLIEVDINNPRIHLRQDADGQWNLEKALTSKTPPSPSKYSVYLNKLALHHGLIDLQEPAAPKGDRYVLSELSLSGSAQILTQAINAETEVQSCRIEAPGVPATVVSGRLTYNAGSHGTTVTARNIGLATKKSAIEASLSAEDFGAKALSAKILIRRLAHQDLLMVVPTIPIRDSDLNGEIDVQGRIDDINTKVALSLGQAHLTGNASVQRNRQPFTYDFDAKLENFDASTVSAISNSIKGTVDAKIRGSGAGREIAMLNGDSMLKVTDLSASGQPIGTLAATLQASNGSMTAHADARGPSGTAILDGRASLTSSPTSPNGGFRLSLRAQHLNLAKVFATKTISRTDVNFVSNMEGTGLTKEALRSKLSLVLSRSTVGTFEMQRARIDAAISNQKVTINDATFDLAGVDLNIRGGIGIASPFETSLDYKIQAAQLKNAFALANITGDGDIAINGRIKGVASGKNGPDLRVIGTADANDLSVGTLSAHALSSRYDIADVGQPGPSGTVAMKVNQVHSQVDLRNVDINAVIARARPPRIALTASAEDREGDRDVLAADLTLKKQRLDGTLTQASIAFDQGHWDLKDSVHFWKDSNGVGMHRFEMRNGERSIAVDGSMDWSGAQNLKIIARSMDLGIISALTQNSRKLEGTVSADAAIAGTAAAPQLTLNVRATKLGINDIRIGEFAFIGKYHNDEAAIDASIQQDARHSAKLRGDLPMNLQWAKGFTIGFHEGMALRFDTPGLRAAPLGAIAPRTLLGVTGKIVADVALSGTPFKPIANGTFGLENGTGQILPLGVKVTDIQVALSFSPSALRIDHLSASADDGKLNGRGAVALSNYAPGDMKLALQVSRWPAINTSRYKANIDGTVTATGTLNAPRVKGKIDVRDATLRPDLAFLTSTSKLAPDETIVVIRPGEKEQSAQSSASQNAPASSATPVPTFNNLDLNVTVSIHRNSWIRQDDATAELEGDLQVKKRPGEEAIIIGTIRTVRGWLRFQGRQFDLVSGNISFTGGHQIDPSLDIDAQYKLPDYTVDVLVGGTANRPTLKLTSSPQLEQADILSLILFGKPASSLGSGQRQDLQQSATQMASGAAATAVGKAVGQALGLEGLGVELNDVSGGGVGFGRYVGNNTYVSVAQTVGGEQGHQASVQYNITDWLSITSTSYSDGSAQVMLGFNKQY